MCGKSTTKFDVSTVTKKLNELFLSSEIHRTHCQALLSQTINAKYKANSFQQTGERAQKHNKAMNREPHPQC